MTHSTTPAAAPVRAWFPTLVYCMPLQPRSLARYNADLAEECRRLRDFDDAGRAWSETHYPGGYTSYGSMAQLHEFSSTFAGLRRKLDRHVKSFARALEWDLRGRALELSDIWVNIMPEQVAHSSHLHPNSVVSGTYYVQTPEGCPGLKFEDPRLDRFMAAPPRKAAAGEAVRPFVTYPAQAGNVILFESWLRHEVPANRAAEERISISFNYALV